MSNSLPEDLPTKNLVAGGHLLTFIDLAISSLYRLSAYIYDVYFPAYMQRQLDEVYCEESLLPAWVVGDAVLKI